MQGMNANLTDIHCPHIGKVKRDGGGDVITIDKNDHGKTCDCGGVVAIEIVVNCKSMAHANMIAIDHSDNARCASCDVIQKLIAMDWGRNKWQNYLRVHNITISKRTTKGMPVFSGSPSLEVIGVGIITNAMGTATLELASSAVTRDGQGLLMNWEMKNPLPLASGKGWQAWHGTPLPYIISILKSRRLLPGSADPHGIF